MSKKQTGATTHWLQTTAVRVTRVHFVLIAFFILVTVIFDSWNLYTYSAVKELYTAGAVLLVANTILWFLARQNYANKSFYVFDILALVMADIVFISYNIYWQHGLASKSVMLFAIPIITSATLRSRSTLLATTIICAASYTSMAVRYFYTNYGLSYRVELWGTIGFYSAVMFVLAMLLLVIIAPTREKF